MSTSYVHGYNQREAQRLTDQASTLVELLHHDTHYPPGTLVLEAGCGVGAQTVTLAAQSPDAIITSIDVSAESVAQARQTCEAAGLANVSFEQGDIFTLRFTDATFDHVFLCFVLEHLPNPTSALEHLKRVVKPGGTVTIIEGDHGSTFFHPASAAAQDAINCQVELQHRAGGNANIGRELFPVLTAAGLSDVRVSPRFVYVDGSKPELVEGFTRNTFTAMIEAVRAQSIDQQLITEARFDEGIRDLYRTAEQDGTFCYTFFKAVATRQPDRLNPAEL
jgi:SAM-dependent methyltransferase